MEKGKVYSISVSPERGQLKSEVSPARFIENFGIEGDGHAGDWGRQVTCLDLAAVRKSNQENGLNCGPGDFAENVLIDGLDLSGIVPGSRLKIGGNIILEVTQIGKEDHPSVVSRKFGVSLLPTMGLFCRVIKGGTAAKGSSVEIL